MEQNKEQEIKMTQERLKGFINNYEKAAREDRKGDATSVLKKVKNFQIKLAELGVTVDEYDEKAVYEKIEQEKKSINSVQNTISQTATAINDELDTDDKTITVTIDKGNKKTTELKQTSIRFDKEALGIITGYVKEKETSVNAAVKQVLEKLYNEKTKDFGVDIPTKEIRETTTCPVKMRKDIIDSLNRQADNKNMSVGEYCSEIFKRITLE